MLLAVLFNLDAIASIGSAVALLIFTFITAAHFRVRAETGANAAMLTLAIASAGVVLLTFVFTTLIHEPASVSRCWPSSCSASPSTSAGSGPRPAGRAGRDQRSSRSARRPPAAAARSAHDPGDLR